MYYCPICHRSFFSHAKTTCCRICKAIFHINCITLYQDDQITILDHSPSWYCTYCISEMFPFNHIKNDQTFLAEINNFTLSDRVAALSDVLFQPFELNDNDYYSPLFDVDPDVNFYNKIDCHTGFNCNYYMEELFSDAPRDKIGNSHYEYLFSMCHINIKSIPANPGSIPTVLELRFLYYWH